MNTYVKYCPNVFIAKCTEQQTKLSNIYMTTKYGDGHEAIVFNEILNKDGLYYYSVVRADGYNIQERAKAKAERLQNWANSAENKSNQYYKASQEGKDFLVLAEPIKIGHHSEKKHRALIDRNWDRMGKCVQFSDKAKEYENRAEYWAKQTNIINLSMPESLEYYEYELEKAKAKHEELKNNPEKRSHSFSLTYAKKELNEITKKLETAKILWQ